METKLIAKHSIQNFKINKKNYSIFWVSLNDGEKEVDSLYIIFKRDGSLRDVKTDKQIEEELEKMFEKCVFNPLNKFKKEDFDETSLEFVLNKFIEYGNFLTH